MSSSTTFATLRALHSLIGDALDEIELVFSQGVFTDTPSPPSSRLGSGCPRTPETSPPASSIPTTPSASFPPTPLSATFAHNLVSQSQCSTQSLSLFDYPSPNKPYEDSLQEQLAAHPRASSAALKIVAACGQISNIVQKPFLTICDAIMAYSLPACLRLIEHLHIVEILREAEEKRQALLFKANRGEAASSRESPSFRGILQENLSSCHGSLTLASRENNHHQTGIRNQEETDMCFPLSDPHRPEGTGRSRACKVSETACPQEGLHVKDIVLTMRSHSSTDHIDPSNLAHALRLLATHHLLRETAPDVFALTRVISLLDTGKTVEDVFASPAKKYTGTNGIAAFVGLTADELFKSAAYLTEAFTCVQLPTSLSPRRQSNSPGIAKEGSQTESVGEYIPSSTNSVWPSAGLQSNLSMMGIDAGCKKPGMGSELHDPFCDAAVSRFSNIATEGPVTQTHRSPFAPHAPHPVEASTPTASQCCAATLKCERHTIPAFNLAFHTTAPYFEWLENGGIDLLGKTGVGAGPPQPTILLEQSAQAPSLQGQITKSFRLERFSEAMTGTCGWEAPGAIFSGFDWQSLPQGSTIVDVGGGIGSTTMVLARAFCTSRQGSEGSMRSRNDQLSDQQVGGNRSSDITDYDKSQRHGSNTKAETIQKRERSKHSLNFRFIVQDKPVVIKLGLAAWRSQCPDLLHSGQVEFQEHDFFQPQPLLKPPHHGLHPAVYLLRVVLHDWTDTLAHRILLNLRLAAGPETKLIIADHVLALACIEEGIRASLETDSASKQTPKSWTLDSILANLEGAEATLAPSPLLPNLGKASANGYWMDMLMHITFNGKERTLREICALALSAGWRVARMSRSEGSLFAHLVCEVIPLAEDMDCYSNIHESMVVNSSECLSPVLPALRSGGHFSPTQCPALMPFPPSLIEHSASRCGTPTFGSRMSLQPIKEICDFKDKAVGRWNARKWLKSKGLGKRVLGGRKPDHAIDESQDTGGSQTEASGFEVYDEPPDRSNRNSSRSARAWWKKPSAPTNGADILIHSSYNHSRPRPPLENDTISRSAHATMSSQQLDLSLTPTSKPLNLRPRKTSIASITQKLSFASFRRPSFVDLGQPILTPPAIPMTDAGPPQGSSVSLKQTSEGRLRHLQSLPALRFKKAAVDPGTLEGNIPPKVVHTNAHGLLSPSNFVALNNYDGSAEDQESQSRHELAQDGASIQSVIPFPLPPSERGHSASRSSENQRVRWQGVPRRLSIPLLRRKESRSADVLDSDGQ